MHKKALTIFAAGAVWCILGASAHAATIEVNDSSDSSANDGACTLREAILAANTNTSSGVAPGECVQGDDLPTIDTVTFNITGPADFTNQGENGYTIAAPSGIPAITQAAVIDGYTQPGAAENTAVSPRPLNGTLLIEISGQNSGGGVQLNGDNVTIRGLVLNRFQGTAVLAGGDNGAVMGNYIGVDPTGLIERPNGLSGINGGVTGFTDGDDLQIGSSNAADRNVISGNNDAGITPNTGQDRWVVKGNYIGIGSDGVTVIPNSYHYNGPGGMSIDNCEGAVVGGSEVGAANVISGNNNFAIFPDNTENLVIQGNIIGPDWKGDPLVGSMQPGGIGLVPLNGDINETLIGGANPGEGNTIAHNKGPAVVVMSANINGNLVGSTTKAAILGNSMFSNGVDPTFPISVYGLGIDLLTGEFTTATIMNGGVTLNDLGDTDTGPNEYINFPVLDSATESDEAGEAIINYSLDAAGSPTGEYRIEFFGNDESDPLGYGEGQTFLGAVSSNNGSDQQAALVLPSGYSLKGKSISATATAIDSTADSGFGATSEFAKNIMLAAEDEELASTGGDVRVLAVFGSTLCALATLIVATHRQKISRELH